MSRSMLVRLKVVFPLFCISLVSGPGDETHSWILVIKLSYSKANSLWGPAVLYTKNTHHSFLEGRYIEFTALVGNLGRNLGLRLYGESKIKPLILDFDPVLFFQHTILPFRFNYFSQNTWYFSVIIDMLYIISHLYSSIETIEGLCS